jgi:hypothetical protein
MTIKHFMGPARIETANGEMGSHRELTLEVRNLFHCGSLVMQSPFWLCQKCDVHSCDVFLQEIRFIGPLGSHTELSNMLNRFELSQN